jgi:hypothetical protein
MIISISVFIFSALLSGAGFGVVRHGIGSVLKGKELIK